jgi:hypothetical protein
VESKIPESGAAVATSDQRVSLRRSSHGKSKRVASVMVVSSMETLSTQSNSTPIGQSSRMAPARSRMIGSSLARFGPATIGLTVLRCTSCLGGSMAMNIGSVKSSAGSGSTIVGSDEKASWLVSTAMMSFHLVTDQYPPMSFSALSAQWTGSSARRRSK